MQTAEQLFEAYLNGAGRHPMHHMYFNEFYKWGKEQGGEMDRLKAVVDKWRKSAWIQDQLGGDAFDLTDSGRDVLASR